MKKILVVLLVLAVAGSVFAQSSNWSMAATAEMGTRIDFDPRNGGAPSDNPTLWNNADGKHVSLANGLGYNWWDVPRMKAVLTYSGTGYVAEFQMNTRHDNEFFISFARPTYKAKCGVWGFEDIFWSTGDEGQVPNNSPVGAWPFTISNGVTENNTIKRLWGEYYLLDEMITIEVAYRGEELEFWTSDETGVFYKNWGPQALWINVSQNWNSYWYKNHGAFDNYFTFTHSDGFGYFRTNLSFSGVDLGIYIPNVFGNGKNGTTGYAPREAASNAANEFVAGSLKKSIFGAKINLYPVEFAAQFKFEDYGVYFGGRFFLGPVTIGASFMGILNPEDDVKKRIRVGGQVAYDAGQMGAGVKAYMDRSQGGVNGDITKPGTTQLIGIQPYFFFKIIPSHLGFKLDAGFFFSKTTAESSKSSVNDMYWMVQPQLFWNFRGTGASLSYPWGSAAGASTCFIARYRMVSNTYSALDLIFSISM